MKIIFVALLGFLLMATSSYACNSCDNSCFESTVNKCQCSDPNYNSNPCLTIDQYCEAFGNISGLDPYP
ncbi:MAG: hypothetical protein JO131_09060 [Gammaproteobacteria bacterium]|nr:hypothetical protein [Gammaproteobacteria bacterium]